ncbi:phage gp6-like head-tail connector protein [Chitinophaga oryzae]|uniref:Phage gp6-like head-tail connector protein n=1 Tax=Chitinophaga oryzae TaxID=2725414 RepID=A0ABX6LI50_9BACT|nr:head-tail connector protein [Chitinophaga oryzae]QJB39732.1 phage gp6-like head-tail connector protein [Chitinophaga oryzae]
MLRNRIVDKKATTTGTTEPVALQDAKNFLRVSFDDDDNLIQNQLKAARELLEKHLNISIISKEVTVVFSHDGYNFQLPAGPVGEVSSASFGYEPDDVVITSSNYRVIGQEFKSFRGTPGYWTVKYTAGYSEVPEAIRQGILKQVAWMYENRGDVSTTGQINTDVLYLLSAYNKNTWL